MVFLEIFKNMEHEHKRTSSVTTKYPTKYIYNTSIETKDFEI